jgi:hypothetical protein
MRKTLIMLTVIGMMSGCDMVQKRSETQKESELEAATTNAENSLVTETKCFLDFEFGMTELEVNNHLRRLHKEGKVYLNGSRDYQYDFSTNSGLVVQLNFAAEYFENKLYKMIFPSRVSTGSKGAQVFLFGAFQDSRATKDNFKTYILNYGLWEDDVLDTYYVAIKDNMIVTFNSSEMTYENAPISKIAKRKRDENLDMKYRQSQSEF